METNIRESKTHFAIPPGETIQELLQDRGLRRQDLAAELDMSENHLSKLIDGDIRLSPEIAGQLEDVLGVPASFWNNLEAIYRKQMILVQTENDKLVGVDC